MDSGKRQEFCDSPESMNNEENYENETGGTGEHRFQVDLRGVIEILAKHLYSTPTVFVRELLQNSCDAIQMRREIDPEHRGNISIEVIGGDTPTLVCSDDGVGLTMAEVHKFLSTVGASAKRRDLLESTNNEFIGQFGIGLLSCFTVSDEITLITRSAREPDAPACKWTAHADGTYELSEVERDVQAGATVYLRAEPGKAELFEFQKIADLATHWGRLLPYEIDVTGDQDGLSVSHRVAGDNPLGRAFDRQRAYDFGAEIFPEEPDLSDVIPLQSDVGGVEGFAYVLGRPSPQARAQKHRVYLKGMLLSETNESILPEWAFFVRGVFNAQSLRPTASREDFYEDEILEAVRDRLGASLRAYLFQLSKADPERLQQLISLHWLSFKALAVEDDDFFKLVIGWLPFITTLGRRTFAEIAEESDGKVRYTTSSAEFRQISGVAGAQALCVVDGEYTYDPELLERVNALTEYRTERLDLREMTEAFSDLTMDEREGTIDFLRVADLVLQRYRCSADIRRFLPEEVPVFFVSNDAANFLTSVELSREGSDPMVGSILDTLSEDAVSEAYTTLCFNFAHPQIRRLVEVRDREVIAASVRMLYVQALLLGQQPLTRQDLGLLTDGIGTFIDWGIALNKEGRAK